MRTAVKNKHIKKTSFILTTPLQMITVDHQNDLQTTKTIFYGGRAGIILKIWSLKKQGILIPLNGSHSNLHQFNMYLVIDSVTTRVYI